MTGEGTVSGPSQIIRGLVVAAAVAFSAGANAQDVKHYRFAYDQPRNTGYSIAGDLFADKLKELSKGTMIIDQYPGAQLGQEPQVLQLVKAGDVLHVIGTGSQGVRSIYSKKEIHKVDDIKGMKVRVQATATEDTMFPAYGAQTVHMPFGSVYTSLQTGVVDAAENSINVYLVNKHYEVAPVLSITEHEANNALVFISDKLWQSLSAEQRQWVLAAAAEVSAKEPAKAFELERNAATKLKSMGVKIVDDVDKKSFTAIADPYLDKLAKELGPHAEKIKNLIRSIN